MAVTALLILDGFGIGGNDPKSNAILAAGKVFIDDLGDKIAGLFHCVLSPPHKVPARRAGLGSICFDYSVKPPVVQAKTVLRAQKAVRFAP